MTRRPKLSDRQIAALPRKTRRYIVADPEQRSHYLRVPVSGPVVYTAVVKVRGKATWKAIATTDEIGIDEARERVREIVKRVKSGRPPVEPPKPAPQTVAAVAENWLRRVVEAGRHRTAAEKRRIITRYIIPAIGERDFVELRRSDIALLLDQIQDNHGPQMADSVLATLRAIAGWVQSRSEDYRPPFVRGMKRTPKQQSARSCILSDDELQRVWRVAGEAGGYGALVRISLLTAQRRSKVVGLRWADVDVDGVWNIPSAEREKGNAGRLQLPQIARDIIEAQPKLAGSPFIFAVHPLSLGRAKRKLDQASGVTGWVLHDLRRTARSLMSRAGVQSEIAERVLGHVVGGVRGIYDRHEYFEEKGHALRQLAALIERIVNPPIDNVIIDMREAVV
jgi:integrase